MEKILPLTIDFESCMLFYERLFDEKNYEEAFINLKEAKAYADTPERKETLYNAFIEFYIETKNYHAIVQACIDFIIDKRTGDYYSFNNFNDLIFGNAVSGEIPDDDAPAFNIPDTDQIEKYEVFNKAKRALWKGEFKNFAAICNEMEDESPYYDTIMDELHKAIVAKPEIINDTNVFRLACKFYRESPENIDAIDCVFASGSLIAVREIASKVDSQIDYYRNYYYGLIELSNVYAKVKAYDVAEKVLDAAIASKPMEEGGLWYHAQLAFLMGKYEEGEKRLKRYGLICSDSGVPYLLYSDYFYSKELVFSVYPSVSSGYRKALYDKFFEMTNKGEPFTEYNLGLLEGLLIVESKQIAKNLLLMSAMNSSEGVVDMLKRILTNHRVSDFIKNVTINILIEHGYEGSFSLAVESKIVCGNLLEFRSRGISEAFRGIYNSVLTFLIVYCSDVPINCTALSKIIKARAKLLGGDIKPKKVNFEKVMVLNQYAVKVGVPYNIAYFLDYLDIGVDDFMKYRMKFDD